MATYRRFNGRQCKPPAVSLIVASSRLMDVTHRGNREAYPRNELLELLEGFDRRRKIRIIWGSNEGEFKFGRVHGGRLAPFAV